MRWSVVRLIAAREVRDQLRDRRTLFLILGLPVLMYPLFVGVGILFVTALKEKKLVVGLVGVEHLPRAEADLAPVLGGPGGAAQRLRAYPSLLGPDGQFAPAYATTALDSAPLRAQPLDAATDEELTAHLASRRVDAIVVIDPGTATKLDRDERPTVRVLGRDGEENSKLAVQRITSVLQKWADDVKGARFARRGLPPNFDKPIEIRDPQSEKTSEKKIADDLRDMLVKVIPFLLVMWMLTGAIYPAIDMTAGEKERGTMETLLISPAERTEIVAGKFLATTCFSFGTAMWNVTLMLVAVAVAPLLAPGLFGHGLISIAGLAACILAAVPLAMLFAALALSLGIFARSTKEGNYYMVPLFFVVLPLAYWSMTPGIELDGFTRWVPMANALLFQQRLMSVRPDAFPWQHAPAVFGSLSLCVALALFAAVRQFHREGVLFRESEAGGKGGWSLFGKK
ncbi:ABC-type Na+ efflux pump, permease component OS=Singulisphaera acidiphila (strain ATCC BAA-1392 / DSM 18658 / VKM B-2454 / MOB10) GN=Sinac_6077 PE=4 SV=1: ABC2_membrane_2 [Gemmata massiliana]|uniref:ABC-2 type transporter domain-containing protein n=1 Tax=Gemmata massiliana TaxID=1210884 RepID=A0A6P2CS58_9BACT|nr:ABC transporter permease subunit [Gemmata massiliana]VTR90935.1 ABC-type Na+ efflux pump, permease component OS=Singulisphaera acidiphila (strain ATCC BAA-1392 / DSM 18658 / VKM B-2454 / MOB10) GN=Sinac_6077 PE=4 SV=1: ABC2_membrane_2 [Gemmata massiliana]